MVPYIEVMSPVVVIKDLNRSMELMVQFTPLLVFEAGSCRVLRCCTEQEDRLAAELIRSNFAALALVHVEVDKALEEGARLLTLASTLSSLPALVFVHWAVLRAVEEGALDPILTSRYPAFAFVHVALVSAVDAGALVLTATSKLLTSVGDMSSNFAALASVQVTLVSAVDAGALDDTSASR